MRRPKLSLMVFPGLVLLGLVSAAWAGTQFNSVDVKDLVTLVSSFDSDKSTMDFVLLKRDGTAESNFYRIKSGNFLVVTDVQFAITGGPAAAGQLVTLEILIVKLSSPSKFTVPFSIPVKLDGDGNGAATIPLNAGFVIDSSARLGADTPGSDLIKSNVQIILKGYTSS